MMGLLLSLLYQTSMMCLLLSLLYQTSMMSPPLIVIPDVYDVSPPLIAMPDFYDVSPPLIVIWICSLALYQISQMCLLSVLYQTSILSLPCAIPDLPDVAPLSAIPDIHCLFPVLYQISLPCLLLGPDTHVASVHS